MEAAPQREIRKTVTVLFCDVVDSTRLGARLDPESLRQVMSRYFEVARAALQRHGGTVEKFIGDAVMGVFGVPTVHEDDALRAVRAAADLRDAMRGLNDELAGQWGVELTLRMGLNTGQVIAGDPAGGQTLVTGDAVNVAARFEQAAGPSEILIGPVTWTLVRDAVVAEPVAGLVLKGKDDVSQAYRLVSVTPNVLGRARRTDTPMVGRERERRLLDQAFERSVAESGCHLFTVLGPAGVGKSRLVHDFLADVRATATVVRGRCLDYGEGITFWPIVEIAREAAGAEETDDVERLRARLTELMAGDQHGELVADRLAALAGTDEVANRAEEVPWAVRKFLENLARHRPLVVVLDDLHWAEPTLLDLVEHVADWSREAPILLLCIARPELLDERPGWAGGKLNATSILLEPLSPVESATLVANLLGQIADGEAVRTRIAAAAEGNPLFVEELVAMLVEDGLLVREGNRWVATADLGTTPIPPTISALLAARLDRLAVQERSVVERASVVGKVFYRTAVAELSPSEVRPDVANSLMALVRKELIRPDRSGFLGDDAFRFRHLLIRDAAYEAMPRRERAELHERLADWLYDAAAGKLAQFEEILGHHLEQAYRQRAGIGMADEHVIGLARRASRHLAAAGRRASALFDVPASLGLLRRAWEVAPEEDRAAIAADLVSVLVDAGRLDEAREVLDGTEAPAASPGAVSLRVAGLELECTTRGRGLIDLEAELESLLPVLEREPVGPALVRGLHLLARLHWEQGHVRRADELTQRALDGARGVGDMRRASHALTQLAYCSLIGPTPVDEAIDRCQTYLVEAGEDRRLRASLLQTVAGLRALRGEFEESRRLAAECTAVFEDLGLELAAGQAAMEFAIRELLAGDPLAAEAVARRGFETLQQMGEKSFLCNCAAVLAQALSLQGLHHEAGRFAAISAEVTDDDDVAGQVQWRMARARVASALGRSSEAVFLAESALERLAGTEFDFLHGDALFDLAQVYRQAGRHPDAVRAARAALEVFERKGVAAVTPYVVAFLDELSDEQLSGV
ncbi:ATP-binding protein [Geodermatophilus sp. CPCC 205506]|uniref:ATP-binding protein n=1 Tax=Geodermatophilus sp. CPCC 205506 TaxID=2936596 RepID=UPI003EED7FCC